MPDSPAGTTRSGGSSQPGPKRKKEETPPLRFLPASRLDWKPQTVRRSPPANRRRGWKADPLVVSVKPGYGAWSRQALPMFRDRERAELRSPESERAVYEVGKSCQEKKPREHKIFDSACPKYLSVVVRFQLAPRVFERCGLLKSPSL